MILVMRKTVTMTMRILLSADGNDERTCSELSSIEIKPTLAYGVQVSDDIPISNSAAVVPNILVITHQT